MVAKAKQVSTSITLKPESPKPSAAFPNGRGTKEDPLRQPGEDVDLVNNPPHYNHGGVECIEAIKSALTHDEYRGFLKGQVMKYTWREGLKGGTEDLKKGRFYLNALIDLDE